jgi:RHS repeat-associated protein
MDGNGNVAATISASAGRLSSFYEYDPFGKMLRREGEVKNENSFAFSTKRWRPDTEFSFYEWRVMANARWTTRDPLDEDGSCNLYAYVDNNCVNHIDPDGRYVDRGNTPIPGHTPVPRYNPPHEGHICCCTEPPHMQVLLMDTTKKGKFGLKLLWCPRPMGCFEDLDIQWYTCWRAQGPGGGSDGGVLAECTNKDECSWSARPGNMAAFEVGIYIRWLICNNDHWEKSSGKSFSRFCSETWDFPWNVWRCE